MVQIIFGLCPFIFIVCASCLALALIQRCRHQVQNESVESVQSMDCRVLSTVSSTSRLLTACHQRDPLKMVASFRVCRFVNTWHDYGMHHCRLSDFDFVMNDDLKTYSDVTPHLDVTVVVFNAL